MSNEIIKNRNRLLPPVIKKAIPEYQRLGLSPGEALLHQPSGDNIKKAPSWTSSVVSTTEGGSALSDPNQEQFVIEDGTEDAEDAEDADHSSMSEENLSSSDEEFNLDPGSFALFLKGKMIAQVESQKAAIELIDKILFDSNSGYNNIDVNDLVLIKRLEINIGVQVI